MEAAAGSPGAAESEALGNAMATGIDAAGARHLLEAAQGSTEGAAQLYVDHQEREQPEQGQAKRPLSASSAAMSQPPQKREALQPGQPQPAGGSEESRRSDPERAHGGSGLVVRFDAEGGTGACASLWRRYAGGRERLGREGYTRFCVEAANFRGLDDEAWARQLQALETDEASGISFANFELLYTKHGRDAERDLAWLNKRERMLAAGELNLQSPWGKYTCGGRAYYWHADTKAFSLEPPPEGVCWEEEKDAEEFERGFVEAGRMDSGEINLQSSWAKYTYQGRALYQDHSSKPVVNSLKPPAEGVKSEQEIPEAAAFETNWVKAGKMDRGEIKLGGNPQSKWFKYSCGERSYYYHAGTKASSLKPPPEGVCQEEEEDAEKFEKCFAKAGKFDSGAIKLGGNPQSKWFKYSCGERAYYYHADTKAFSLQPPAEGVKQEEEEGAEEFEKCFAKAGKMDRGELNPQSEWTKHTCQGRCYYYHWGRKVFSLKPPPEGVWGEKEDEPAKFEPNFITAGKYDSGAIKLGNNPQSSWAKVSCGERACYYHEDTKAYSLQPPPDGVCREEEEGAEQFEANFVRAGKMDRGELNPQSPWIKFTYQGRAFYQNKGTKPLVNSLMPPAEGIRSEQEILEAQAVEFEKCFVRAGRMDSGEINLQSKWAKYTCGERAYYHHGDTKAFSLQPPAEGVCEEIGVDAQDHFEANFVKAGKMDRGEINLQSPWTKFSCGARAYYHRSDTKACSLLPPDEGVREEKQSDELTDFLEACGLGAWHGHLTKHLDVTTPDDVRAITAADLQRMATAANMRLDQKTIDQVLQAAGRNPTSGGGFETGLTKARNMDVLSIEGTIARTVREGRHWLRVQTPSKCRTELQAAKLRLVLGFLQSARLMEHCPLTLNVDVAETIGAALKGFAEPTLLVDGAPLEFALGDQSPDPPEMRFRGAVVVTQPPLADSELTNAVALAGAVALAHRGGCTFAEKAQRAAAAGAVALIVVTGFELMKPGKVEESPIPVLTVRASAGEALASAQQLSLTLTGCEQRAALDEQLVEAAFRGDAVAIERLVRKGASPDAKKKDSPYAAAVWLAADDGHTAAVEALLRLGADPDATSSNVSPGGTALMQAAWRGRAGAAAALLRGGAAVDAVNEDGETALMRAARYGQAECARLLLEAGADATLRAGAGFPQGKYRDRGIPWGKTALEVAQAALAWRRDGCGLVGGYGHVEVVALLVGQPLEREVAQLPQETKDEMLLKQATDERDADAVAVLLQGGAAADAVNEDGDTTLMRAAYDGQAEIARLLLEAGADASLRATGALWDSCAPSRSSGWAEGKTALEVAEERGKEEKGPYESDEKFAARQKGCAEVVALLVERLSPAEKAQWEKRQAEIRLCKAANAGDAAAIERLAGEGASPDAKDERGDPAVYSAAEQGHTAAVEALLRLGADPNATESDAGGTALMIAAQCGHADTMVALLQGGAALDAVDEDGETALMRAARCGHAECARLLLEVGADATLRATDGGWEGQTALEMAEEEVVDSSDEEEEQERMKKGQGEVVALLRG